MGKGKGSFDHWAARVAVSQIVFEISGEMHEQVVRDAIRLAGNKMPGEFCTFVLPLYPFSRALRVRNGCFNAYSEGRAHGENHADSFFFTITGQYEFVKKGEPPVMGLTKMTSGITLADLQKPRRQVFPGYVTAGRLPSSSTRGHLPDTPAPLPSASGSPTPT